MSQHQATQSLSGNTDQKCSTTPASISKRTEFTSPALICLGANISWMRSAIGIALRTALNPIATPACRFVGGSRYPLSRRSFHRSAVSFRIPDSQGTGDSEKDNIAPEIAKQPEQGSVEGDVAGTSTSLSDADSLATSRKARQAKSGLGRLRVNRQRQPEGLPPVILPDWFWDKNVKRVEDPPLCGNLTLYGTDNSPGAGRAVPAEVDVEGQDKLPKYEINVDVYHEILSTFKAGLTLRPPRTGKNIQRPAIHLLCPKDGGTYYLNSVVETMASKLGADLVRLDAQDIAQIVGPYVDENLAWTESETSHLGYSAQRAAGKLQVYSQDKSKDIKGSEDAEEILSILREYQEKLAEDKNGARTAVTIRTGQHAKRGLSGQPLLGIFGIGNDPISQVSLKSGTDQWDDLKLATALDAFISAADSKRGPPTESENSDTLYADAPMRDIILQVNDYTELGDTRLGPTLLRTLRSVVNKRWQEGRNIILVGTTATADLRQSPSKGNIQFIELEALDNDARTIFVPPNRREKQDIAFDSDEKARIRQINIRHIEDMIVKLDDGNQTSNLVVDIEKNLDHPAAYSAGIEDSVWPFSRVRRLATIILGFEASPTHIDGSVLAKALKLLADSDVAKFDWGAAEMKIEDEEANSMLEELAKSPRDITEEKLDKVRKRCSPHEKRLLRGVKIPSDIHTTFNDVHAPKETIEALKTLTSLSLIRPEAFSYGVLATDKIPGLLLYGPPGTGKTLLAKAVAKESGAIVLEVSGASVNDMYVGEGEKNVRAIFTLAKKLSPCVVFIDEADALLAARGGGSKRSGSHRDIINQFLREWDGMSDHSAFIMVATNRPFDLDEAVLRRLPRRLLVDLPVERDRESILKIHLHDEILDESVSIAELAKNTPYYSGSDLKNVSVAAALACLREENDMAAKHTDSEPYVFPAKRTLTKQHFDKALDEISASISEDMSTLSAIRKFDEKYGDRKGRRKSTGLGFGGTMVEEKDSDGGRVRKIPA